MLEPAICKAEEITEKMHEYYYSKEMFYYVGALGSYVMTIPEDNDANTYKWASVDKDGKLVGYIAYQIDWNTRRAYNFGLFSFDKGNLTLAKDLDDIMKDLCENHGLHSVEWRGIEGNHVLNTYDRFCAKMGGTRSIFHDIVKDDKGKFHNEYVYEIILDEAKENERYN